MTDQVFKLHRTETNTEVLRIAKGGIWVNPDMSVDDAAKAVLQALDAQIKTMVQRAVEDEREACAKVCEEEICNCCWDDDAQAAAEHLAAAIRARSTS